MRLLHTSDWHLGRSFHREGMLDAQSAFVDHLVETVRAERVDVVLVSGDVYDRALPPVDAVELASDALARLLAAKVRVVITSGNHDSAQRLGFASGLIDAAGIHLRTRPDQVGVPVVIPDDHGDVAIYGLPYLEPDVIKGQWDLPRRSHQAALNEAMTRVRTDLSRRHSRHSRHSRTSGISRRSPTTRTRSVVMAHAFVVGAEASESERDISVGGVASVGLDTFDGVDYAALGHLHGRHTLSERVRYSGSPLAYSFSEARHRKGTWLVELDETGLSAVEFVDAPVPRPLAVIRGTMDSLLNDPRHTTVEGSWVQATITDPERPQRTMDQLRRRFPYTLVLKFEPEGAPTPGTVPISERVDGLSDADVMANFFTDVRLRPPSSAEMALLVDACDACRVAEDAAS